MAACVLAVCAWQEELGLYTEPQALLGYNSLFKMEQRLAKVAS